MQKEITALSDQTRDGYFFTLFDMGATVCRYALSIFIILKSIRFVKGQTGFFVYLRLDSFRQNML